MRKNEFDSIEQVKAMYVGVWRPSDGHWFGLDFLYNGQEYRIHTGTMYGDHDNVVDGVVKQFGLYQKTDLPDEKYPDINKYDLLFEFSAFEELLTQATIDGESLETIIMEDDTEMLGQD